MTVDSDLGHLAEAVFVRFLHQKAPPRPPHSFPDCVLRKEASGGARTKGAWDPLSAVRAEASWSLWSSLYGRLASSPSCSFVPSLVSVRTRGYLCFYCGFNPSPLYFVAPWTRMSITPSKPGQCLHSLELPRGRKSAPVTLRNLHAWKGPGGQPVVGQV